MTSTHDKCPWCGSHSNYCVQPGEAGDPCWENFLAAHKAMLAGRCENCAFFRVWGGVTQGGDCHHPDSKMYIMDGDDYPSVATDFRCIQYQPKEAPMTQSLIECSPTCFVAARHVVAVYMRDSIGKDEPQVMIAVNVYDHETELLSTFRVSPRGDEEPEGILDRVATILRLG